MSPMKAWSPPMLTVGNDRARMDIQEAKKDLTEGKELKVKIPVQYHVKLHSIKILEGTQMRETIMAALDAYFSNHGVPKRTA